MESLKNRFSSELEELIAEGDTLRLAFQFAFNEEESEAAATLAVENSKSDEEKKTLNANIKRAKSCAKNIGSRYEKWLTKSMAVIKQVAPDRLGDFRAMYEKPKGRKTENINFENYSIQDALVGLAVTRGGRALVGPEAAISKVDHQVSILKAVSARFDSTLMDMVALVQADLLDSELDAANELFKHKFFRAAGVIAGVVLEKHLAQVASARNISLSKKNPTLSDWNDKLRSEAVIDTPTWRQIQHLGDIRNLCAHGKDREPTKEEVTDLIAGAAKVSKNVF